jgi:hypothetical protein
MGRAELLPLRAASPFGELIICAKQWGLSCCGADGLAVLWDLRTGRPIAARNSILTAALAGSGLLALLVREPPGAFGMWPLAGMDDEDWDTVVSW